MLSSLGKQSKAELLHPHLTDEETEGQELSDPFKVSDQLQVGLMGLDSERP